MSMPPRLIGSLAWVFLAAHSLASQVQPAGKEPGTRASWRFEAKGETVTIARVQGSVWASDRSDGRRLIYDELSRTSEYVELKSRSSKVILRLHADRMYFRKESDSDSDWKRSYSGRWLTPDETAQRPVVSDQAPAEPERRVLRDPPSGHCVRLAYFVPSDRRPVANYQEKVQVVMAFVTALYRSDLQAKGCATDGIVLESDGGKPVVHLIPGKKPASHYNNAPEYDASEQWRRLVPEIRETLGDTQRQVIVVFAETYSNGPATFLWPGVIALGSYYSADGGLAVYSAHILRDEFCALTVEAQQPFFFDRTPIFGRRALGHGQDSPRCEFVEDGFGAVAHELGHALGLMHDLRQGEVEIMANGFRNLRWNLAPAVPGARRVGFLEENTRLLMSSRYVATDLDLSDRRPPTLQLQLAPSHRPVNLVVQAADESGLRSFTLYDKVRGSIIAGRDLRGETARFSEPLPASLLQPGKLELEGFVTDTGGNRSSATQTFPVAEKP